MENILYILTVIFVIAWAIVYLGFGMGGPVHVLLGMAMVLFIFRFVLGKRIIK